MKNFWEIESFGSQDDNVYAQFKDDIYFDGDRYITKLPFKPHAEVLPDNYQLSLRRLDNLKHRLNKDEILKKEYQDVIASYKRDGIIEKVDTVGETGKVHYLPHRAVVRKDKETTKASCCFRWISQGKGWTFAERLFVCWTMFVDVHL